MEKNLPPAIVAAGIGAAGAIGGGLLASSGASKAAKAQTQADAAAIAEQRRQFDTTNAEFAPYREAGTAALNPLEALLGLNGADAQQAGISGLQQSPLYQSLYRNGLEANLQNAAATGGIRGGNEVRSLADFGSDTLSQVIQNQLRNLGSVVGMGEGATNATAGFGQQTSNNVAQLMQAQGNALASSQLAQAGIWSGVVNHLTSSAQMAAEPSFMKNLF